MRIHLLCDHKWRDLPNLTAIKLKLEALGHWVLLSATEDARAMIKAFRPDCVVFNHLFGKTHIDLAVALRQAGVAVVLLPTEGMTHPRALSFVAGERSDFRVGDLFLFWNEAVAGLARARWGFDEAITPAIGCTRFDFYDPGFSHAVTRRDEFCHKYRFDCSRPIVTWATQYIFAHLEHPSLLRDKFLRELFDFGVDKFFEQLGQDCLKMPSLHTQSRRASSEAFITLARALPDAQFVIKPHPAEDMNFYRALIRNSGLGNIHFCPQDYIWNVLNASDVHLHRHCTTAVEAWMWDKPTIEMAIGPPGQVDWLEREAGSDVVRSADELVAAVDGYLGGGMHDDRRRHHRLGYVHQWYGPADGRRCAAAANAIDRFMAARRRQRRVFSPIRGMSVTPRQAVTSVGRYVLGLRPNELLLQRRPVADVDPQDKLITRTDVRNYGRLLASPIG